MLRMPDESGSATAVQGRIAAFDRARTFVTLLVVLHHSVLNFTWFGNGDPQRWLGFDLVVLFNDSFFMALMFFISGLFVRDGPMRKGWAVFLRDRAWRLGVPFLISIFVLMPIAYYPTFLRYHLPGTTDFSFLHFWRNIFIVGPWPSGPAWFLWVLLALDAIAAAVWRIAPGMVKSLSRMVYGARDRPITVFVIFLAITIAAYEPMRLTFGDASWWEIGALPLPIQTSRILLYAAYFLAGVIVGATDLKTGLLADDGELARRWPIWLAVAAVFYGAILGLVWVHHNWAPRFDAPPRWWSVSYSLAFAIFSAAMCFTVPAIHLRFARARWRLLDAMQPSAYGIYLLHYVFIIWLQYAVYDLPLHAGAKFAIVFIGTLSMSWTLTVILRKIAVVARTI
ncbi:MAG TPA: acyltransferase [Bradyrhizobium sp.]|nr:acyltransferase [Bradyrhizobium sp.]